MTHANGLAMSLGMSVPLSEIAGRTFSIAQMGPGAPGSLPIMLLVAMSGFLLHR